MESTPMIYGAIIDAMGQINAISKDRRNPQQGFAYRGIDDVMNELHSILAKSGIFIVPTVLDEQRTQAQTSRGGNLFYTRLKIKFTFYAKDGSSIESVVIGEAMDSGDKASNKALSIGMKYACLQVFCIPTEEDKDPDGITYDVKSVTPIEKPAEKKPTEEKKIKMTENRLELDPLLESNRENVSKSVYEQCINAIKGSDDSKVDEMLARLKKYLNTKGIAV
jgi:hypothetical protein